MIRFLFLFCIALPVCAQPNFKTLYEYAQLSDIAYSKGDHKAALASINHQQVRQVVLPGVEVNYVLSTRDGQQYLTVRGTANLENALVDLDINLKQDEQLGIMVHQGFARASLAVYNDAKPLLDVSKPVSTSGHSLGGAVAVLLAMYLQVEAFNVQQVITFGQPKVTNVGGANEYEDLPLTRVVTPKDIVPLVPPLSPLQIKNLDIYWHMGQEVILLQGSQYSLTEGVKSMMRATKFASSLPNETNLNAHKMQTYLSLIISKLDQSEEVPYKTGLNLFGLSLD